VVTWSAIDLFMAPSMRILVLRGVNAMVARFIRPLIRTARLALSAASPSLAQASADIISRPIAVLSAPNLAVMAVAVAPGTSTVTWTPRGDNSRWTASPRLST
jgi:hypothetical protein